MREFQEKGRVKSKGSELRNKEGAEGSPVGYTVVRWRRMQGAQGGEGLVLTGTTGEF